MYKDSETMKGVHRIQEKIYEKTKNMSNKEFIDYVHKGAEKLKEKYALKFKVKTAH